MSKIMIFACVFLAATSALSAQPNCKKGIPCGNSCISATKTCRIGTTPPAPPPSTPQPSQIRPLLDQAPAFDILRDSAWVGSVDGNVYYRADCATAKKLHPDERYYFRSEAEAKLLRYVRSKAKGC